MSRSETRDDGSIVIVGAGIVGASIAYHLARAGIRVTVLERNFPASGVTGSSFAWVGLAKSSADTHCDPFRRDAAAEFGRLARELSAPFGLRRGGAITWEETEAETRGFVDGHRARGHLIELISREEVLAREPRLRTAPTVAAFAPDDAGVDPAAFTKELLRRAEERGAAVYSGHDVLSLLTQGRKVCGVATPYGPVYGSTTVLAAGTTIPALAASAGLAVEIEASPCCLIRYSTPYPLVNGILSTPDFEIRQLDDTTLIAAEDLPAEFGGDAHELAEPTLTALRTQFVGGDRVELMDAVVADRPVPRGGRPIFGHAEGVQGLYLAATHPAIILAGAIGARAARDLS